LHPEATWTLTPSDGESTWRVTARGDLGTAVLFGAAETDTVTLERMPEGISPETVPAGFDEGAAILKVLEAALAGEAVRPDWTDLTRDIDIMAACQRSVDSRRTIDLHFERTSERTLFKSQMTAIGCALLIVTFLASLGFLILGSLFDVNETVMRVLRFIIFLPLGIFLLLQLLLVLARPASSDPSPPKT